VRTQADLEGRIRRLVKDSEGKALQHKRTVAALERDVEETTTHIQVGSLGAPHCKHCAALQMILFSVGPVGKLET